MSIYKKNVHLPFLQGNSFNTTRLHQRLLKLFNEAEISLRHLGKSISEFNQLFGPLEIIVQTIESVMTIRLHMITCPGYE